MVDYVVSILPVYIFVVVRVPLLKCGSDVVYDHFCFVAVGCVVAAVVDVVVVAAVVVYDLVVVGLLLIGGFVVCYYW